MRWYRFGVLMGRVRVLLAAASVELLGHWLSVSYALALVAVLIMVTGLRLNAAQVQAKAAHQRIDTLVPHIGAIESTANGAMPKTGGTFTGTVTTQDHHVNGTLYGAGGTLTVGDNTHVSGGAFTADSTITGHGAINADGSMSSASIHASGVGQFDGGVTTAAVTAASLHASGNILANNDVSMSSMNGHGLPLAQVTHDSVSSAANGCVDRLHTLGLLPSP